MSSLHDRDGAAGQQQQAQQQAQRDPLPGSAGGAPQAPSYSAQLNVDYVMTFRGTAPGTGNKNDLRINISSSQDAAPGACLAAAPMSITCNFTVEHGNEKWQADGGTNKAPPTSASQPGPAVGPSDEDVLASARAKRTAALDAFFGMWKDRNDIPDGLQFQKELREEWP